jgi:hypothetical protein
MQAYPRKTILKGRGGVSNSYTVVADTFCRYLKKTEIFGLYSMCYIVLWGPFRREQSGRCVRQSGKKFRGKKLNANHTHRSPWGEGKGGGVSWELSEWRDGIADYTSSQNYLFLNYSRNNLRSPSGTAAEMWKQWPRGVRKIYEIK